MVTAVKRNGRGRGRAPSRPAAHPRGGQQACRAAQFEEPAQWIVTQPGPRERGHVRADQPELLHRVGPPLPADQHVHQQIPDLREQRVARPVPGGQRDGAVCGPVDPLPDGGRLPAAGEVRERSPYRQCPHQRSGRCVVGGLLREVEALGVRAVPLRRQVAQGGHMAAVVPRGAAQRLLPEGFEAGVRGVHTAGVVQGDAPRHRVPGIAVGRRVDQRADLPQQFGPGGGVPGPEDREAGREEQRVRIVRRGREPAGEPLVSAQREGGEPGEVAVAVLPPGRGAGGGQQSGRRPVVPLGRRHEHRRQPGVGDVEQHLVVAVVGRPGGGPERRAAPRPGQGAQRTQGHGAEGGQRRNEGHGADH